LYPQGVWLVSHRSEKPLSFASSSEMQAQPPGQTGVDPPFTQYFGIWFEARALVGAPGSYPQTSAEHRVKVPYRSFAIPSVRQLHPSGQTGVVDPGFMQYFAVWSCS
jgi:hypothetical protein